MSMDTLDPIKNDGRTEIAIPAASRRAAIMACRLFRHMDEAERESLIGRIEWLRVRRGELLVQRQDSGGAIFIVVDGLLLVNQYARSGREVGYRRLGPGRYFGELAAIDKLPRSANIVVLADAQVGRLPDRLVADLLDHSPAFGRALMEDLATTVRALSERVFELSAVSSACRTQMELLRLALEAGIVDNRSTIAKAPTHAEIAALIGSQRESVTRECGRLEAMGLIARKGRTLRLLDAAGLVGEIERLGGDQPGS